MCSGGGGGGYTVQRVEAPKVDPAPQVVTGNEVDTGNEVKKERRRRGRSTTMLSSDRDTILGTLAGGNSASASGRNTLG